MMWACAIMRRHSVGGNQMALNTTNDRALINVVAAYEREIMGPKLTANQLTRIAETTKRMLLDEIHSAKSTGRG